MKPALPIIKHLSILFAMTFAIFIAKGATISSNGTGGGNWSSTSTWVGGIVPGSADVVTIASGDNVTIDVSSAACASLNINTGTANTTSTVTFNSGGILTVSGVVTIGGTGNAKGSINMTSGGTLAAQQFTISKAGTWTAGTGTVQLTATNTLPTTFFTTFNNLTVSAGTTSLGVTITVGGNLSIADAATFTIGAFGITVTGTTTVGTGTGGTLNITSTTGTKVFVGLITINAAATWNNSGNSALTIRGGITNNGTFTSGTGNHTFNTNAQALNGTFTFFTITVTGVTLTNNNTLTVSTSLTGTGGTLIQANNATLNIGGTSTITTLTATNTGNIVNYTGAGQTVKGTNYYYLNLSGSGTKTLATGMTAIAADLTLTGSVKATTVVGLTIGGNLSVGDGTTFTAAGFALTVNGTTTIGGGTSGTFNVTSLTGTKTFVGLITLAANATWKNSGNSAITINNGITNNGTFTSGTGIYSFSINNQVINGPITISKIDVPGVTLTNNNTLTIATSLTGTGGTLIQTTNSTLNLGGTSTIDALTTTATGNTVNYTGSSQTIYGTDYYHLTLSGSGTAILTTSTTTVNGNLTMSGTVKTTTVADLAINGNLSVGDGTTFSVAFGLTVAGTTTIGSGASGVFNITSATGTKTFGDLIRINIGGKWVNSGNSGITLRGGLNYSGTTFTGGSGVYTFDTNDQAISGIVTIPSITVTGINLTNNNTLTVSTALAGSGTLVQAASSTLNLGGTLTITTLTVTNTGNTVGYTGTAQTVRAINYYHLTLGGSSTKTLQTGTTSITGNFTTSGSTTTTAVVGLTIGGNMVLGSTGTFNAGSFTHNVAGNFQHNAGTFTASTSTFNFNGGSAQTIGGTVATTFKNLTINNSNGVSLDDGTNSINKTVSGVLTLTSGLLTTTSSNLLVLASGGSISATVPDPVGNPSYYSTGSYINGPLQATITGTSGLTFPVGKSGTGYVPITLSALFGSSPAPQTFTAEYFHVSAQTMGPIDVGYPQLNHVSGCDYWRLDLGTTYPTSTNSSLPNGVTTNITMYYNPNNGSGCSGPYVTNNPTLVIAHLTFMTGQTYSGTWTAIGGAYNYTGSTSNGTISYVGASTFSPFALGSIDGAQNPLDIKLDYFTAVKAGTYNKLSWKAECTSSSNLFEAQRSSDGINFTSIDSVKIDAASDCSKGFVYNDYSIAGNQIYYRIKATDVDGNISYSDIKLITNQSSTFEFISIHPNPVQSNATLSITSAQDEKIDLAILGIDGRELQHKTIQLQNGTNTFNLQTSDLPKGMYFVKGIFPSGQINTIKFIKE